MRDFANWDRDDMWPAPRAHSLRWWLGCMIVAAALAVLLSLGGCASVKAVRNLSDDLDLIMDQVHADIQRAITQPAVMESVVNYLCDEARMLRADECAKLKAAVHVRVLINAPLPLAPVMP
jgi:hypothetical protein